MECVCFITKIDNSQVGDDEVGGVALNLFGPVDEDDEAVPQQGRHAHRQSHQPVHGRRLSRRAHVRTIFNHRSHVRHRTLLKRSKKVNVKMKMHKTE